ncbi:rhomboid family intramembrane serine protease [Leadbetterella sp. DM7]|uniref:rhomboid family intramembrane serine protease n=1 Tax=Leadbetterella sp. DM7 TaxID=3235085 RepID=UPI00349EA61C
MFSNITPMVKNLLIVNIVIHLLANMVPDDFIRQIFSFHNPILPGAPELWNPNFKPWQIITYMFLHSGDTYMHLFSNMFALLIFGPAIEAYMGSGKFLKYYIICGIGAAFFNMGMDYLAFFQTSQSDAQIHYLSIKSMVGASGAIFGILVAFAMLFPNIEMLLLFFPVPIKAKYFVALYAIFELVQAFGSAATGIAHWAHIGGLITGFILLQFFSFKKRNFY